MIPDSGISTRFPDSSSDSKTHDSSITEILLVIMCLWIVYCTIPLGQHIIIIIWERQKDLTQFWMKNVPQGWRNLTWSSIWSLDYGLLAVNEQLYGFNEFSFFRSSSWKIIFSFKCIRKIRSSYYPLSFPWSPDLSKWWGIWLVVW